MVKIIHFLDAYFEEIICAVGILTVATCVFLQFAVRFLFGSGLAWPEELAVYGMVWSMFIGASMCVRSQMQMRILVFVQRFPRKIALALIMLADTIWFCFNIFMVVVGGEYVILMFEFPMLSPALGVSQAWPHLVIPLAFGLMSFRIIQHYVIWFKNGCQDYPA